MKPHEYIERHVFVLPDPYIPRDGTNGVVNYATLINGEIFLSVSVPLQPDDIVVELWEIELM